MDTPKPSRRKSSTQKLEPIDWHEYANDAVLQGNMSTLYQRPATEDPTAYASPEALVEIEKRGVRPPAPVLEPTEGPQPTDGPAPTVGNQPTVALAPSVNAGVLLEPTAGSIPTVAIEPRLSGPTVGRKPAEGFKPTAYLIPTVGLSKAKRVKPLRELRDALTLAGQVLYRAMYGALEGAGSQSCTKGYRQLAAETGLDKDTVRDLISEFKGKGILRETGSYDPDTRSSKTYEVFPPERILQIWREAGFFYVSVGRHRPTFCTSQGNPLGTEPTVG